MIKIWDHTESGKRHRHCLVTSHTANRFWHIAEPRQVSKFDTFETHKSPFQVEQISVKVNFKFFFPLIFDESLIKVLSFCCNFEKFWWHSSMTPTTSTKSTMKERPTFSPLQPGTIQLEQKMYFVEENVTCNIGCGAWISFVPERRCHGPVGQSDKLLCIKCQNISERSLRTVTMVVWRVGQNTFAGPSTKELRDWEFSNGQLAASFSFFFDMNYNSHFVL